MVIIYLVLILLTAWFLISSTYIFINSFFALFFNIVVTRQKPRHSSKENPQVHGFVVQKLGTSFKTGSWRTNGSWGTPWPLVWPGIA